MVSQCTQLIYFYRLQEDLKKDPWITVRPRKYTAGPRRIPFKRIKELKDRMRTEFLINWILGCAIFWPVGVLVGRRAKISSTGVPVVPMNRYVTQYPNTEPMFAAWKRFRKFSYFTTLTLGAVFAWYRTDLSLLDNNLYNRPDLKPKPAMVKEYYDYEDVHLQQIAQQIDRVEPASEAKKGLLRRFFRPTTSDFNVKVNLYDAKPKEENFYYTNRGKFPNVNHDYQDHQY